MDEFVKIGSRKRIENGTLSMRVLSINKFYWRKGGSEAVFFGEKALLESRGHTVIPFAMKDPKNEASEYDDYFVNPVSYTDRRIDHMLSAAAKIIYSTEASKKMELLLKREPVDVAHFHIFQHQISPSVFGPLRRRNIPLVLTLHDLKPICPNYKMLTHDGVCERCKGRRFYQCMLHRCSKNSLVYSMINAIEMYVHYALHYYQNVTRYIAVSRFYRDKMIAFGFPSGRVKHVPNFIDVSDFPLPREDDGYGLYFGRLSPEKGVATLLRSLELSKDIPFLIVGSGPDEEELRSRAGQSSLGNVTFAGFKTGEDLRMAIARASFIVVPSEWYENCPMSVLEAHAFGKAVIGSRIGGLPELIEEGSDGLLFQPGNHEELADKMRMLWEQRERRGEMGMRGRRKVEREYTRETHYERLLAVYEEARAEVRA